MLAKPRPRLLHGPHTAGIFSDMSIDGPKIGTFVLVVDRAKNLPNRKTIGKQDPYCAARLGKEAKRTATDVRGGQTPRWDQELRFVVHDSPDYYQLKLSIFNDDKKTDLIGETWVDLKGVIIAGGGQADMWQGLDCRGKYAGEIRIEITFYDSRPKPEKLYKPDWQPTDSDSVSLQPATSYRRPLPVDPIVEETASPPVSDYQTTPQSRMARPLAPPSVLRRSPLQSDTEYSTPPQSRHTQFGNYASPPLARHSPLQTNMEHSTPPHSWHTQNGHYATPLMARHSHSVDYITPPAQRRSLAPDNHDHQMPPFQRRLEPMHRHSEPSQPPRLHAQPSGPGALPLPAQRRNLADDDEYQTPPLHRRLEPMHRHSEPTPPYLHSQPAQRRSLAPDNHDKSVSPGPYVHAGETRQSLGPDAGSMPFGPDSFDVMNPSLALITASALVDSKIITHDGREVDPSDHLPIESWAPEPEPRQKPAAAQQRPSPGGAQPMPPSTRRQLRQLQRPQSLSVLPSLAWADEHRTSPSVNPPPPGRAGRNRLQKRPPRSPAGSAQSGASSPLAAVSSLDYQDGPMPDGTGPRTGLTWDHPSKSMVPRYDGSFGPAAGDPRAELNGLPPIPAKMPLHHSQSGYASPGLSMAGREDVALMEEMSRINLGAGRSRRHGHGYY